MKNDATDVGHRVVLLPQINRAEKLRTKLSRLCGLTISERPVRSDVSSIFHSVSCYRSKVLIPSVDVLSLVDDDSTWVIGLQNER